jgi:hypothetical protein
VLGVVGLAVGGSYPKILDNCALLQLAVREDGFQVEIAQLLRGEATRKPWWAFWK